MHAFDELLIESRLQELRRERRTDVTRPRARGRSSLRARAANWLVQAGLWLDPTNERFQRELEPRLPVLIGELTVHTERRTY
jgi:hypothetical protein